MDETAKVIYGVYQVNPFSVFIPVYNEEEVITRNTERLTAFLDTLNTPYEVIIVSNGSTDRTVELGRELENRLRNVKFCHIPLKETGSALREGVSMAAFENIIAVDMDLSVDLDFIRAANALLSEGFDLVVGSKRMGDQKRSVIRKGASTAFIISAMLLLGLSFDDYSIGAKAYKKGLLEKFKGSLRGGTFYVIEVIYYASKADYRIAQIPVTCHDDRKSRFNLMHEGIYRFSSLYRLWFRHVTGRGK